MLLHAPTELIAAKWHPGSRQCGNVTVLLPKLKVKKTERRSVGTPSELNFIRLSSAKKNRVAVVRGHDTRPTLFQEVSPNRRRVWTGSERTASDSLNCQIW